MRCIICSNLLSFDGIRKALDKAKLTTCVCMKEGSNNTL